MDIHPGMNTRSNVAPESGHRAALAKVATVPPETIAAMWRKEEHRYLTNHADTASHAFGQLCNATTAHQQFRAFSTLLDCIGPAHTDSLQWCLLDNSPPCFKVGSATIQGTADWTALTGQPVVAHASDPDLLRSTIRYSGAAPFPHPLYPEPLSTINVTIISLAASPHPASTSQNNSGERGLLRLHSAGTVRRNDPQTDIRELTKDHASCLHTLRLAALQKYPTAFDTTYEEEATSTAIASWKRAIKQPGDSLFGAFTDGELVGVVGLRVTPQEKRAHIGWIWGVYVDEKATGQGLGRRLLDTAISTAHQRPGLTRLSLIVNTASASAISLYESFGFKKFGKEPDALRWNNRTYEAFHMNLDLHKAHPFEMSPLRGTQVGNDHP